MTVSFCTNLVVTHTGSLLQSCLDLLVASFVPPPGYPLENLDDASHWSGRRHHKQHHDNDGAGAGAGAGGVAAHGGIGGATPGGSPGSAPFVDGGNRGKNGDGDAVTPDGGDEKKKRKRRTTAETTAVVVGAVESVLTLVPLAASVLRPILLSRVPHKSSHRALQCQYLRAAFRLVETAAVGGGAKLNTVDA